MTVGRRGRTGKGRSASEGMECKAAWKGEKNGKGQGELARRERDKECRLLDWEEAMDPV